MLRVPRRIAIAVLLPGTVLLLALMAKVTYDLHHWRIPPHVARALAQQGEPEDQVAAIVSMTQDACSTIQVLQRLAVSHSATVRAQAIAALRRLQSELR